MLCLWFSETLQKDYRHTAADISNTEEKVVKSTSGSADGIALDADGKSLH